MTKKSATKHCRNLILVLGDQLNANSAAFDGFDCQLDAVWMAEVSEESTHVWTHKARIALFLAGMRHFRQSLIDKKYHVHYRQLDDRTNRGTLAAELQAAVKRLQPQQLIVVTPGEWRILDALKRTANNLNIPLDVRSDRHFLCSTEQFATHAQGRKQLRLEFFYREMRKRHDVLMDGSKPLGGKWNYDTKNRGSFCKQGPEKIPEPKRFQPDALSKDVIDLVNRRFVDHPGSLTHFDWPVTTRQARQALKDFIQHRLPNFGQYQDAMWSEEPYLFHSRLSTSLNLKLLDPRDVIEAAVIAYDNGHAPLNSVEGFIRQILGWREFVRGVYWLHMPDYLNRNALQAEHSLPKFYWTGETDLNCLRQTLQQTLQYGYAHHIQRLMVTGLFGLLLGVDPQALHQWYLAVYVDAVEWVELPNTLGMSQYADHGVMASKPYVATGKYIKRMSNYCSHCQYDPAKSHGNDACPFTTLYWDFLARHRKSLAKNNRMTFQIKNLSRKTDQELRSIRKQAQEFRNSLQ